MCSREGSHKTVDNMPTRQDVSNLQSLGPRALPSGIVIVNPIHPSWACYNYYSFHDRKEVSCDKRVSDSQVARLQLFVSCLPTRSL